MSCSKFAIIAVSILALPLVGCMVDNPGKPSVSVSLPKAPAYYERCFAELTDIPVGTLTRDKVVILVAELRRSEKRHSKCGRDLLRWYETVRSGYAKS